MEKCQMILGILCWISTVVNAKSIADRQTASEVARDLAAEFQRQSALGNLGYQTGNQDSIWKPEDGTPRDEWLKYHGLGQKEWEDMMDILEIVAHLEKGDLGLEENSPPIDRFEEGCMWYTPEQAQDAFEAAMAQASLPADFLDGLASYDLRNNQVEGSGDEMDILRDRVRQALERTGALHRRQKRKAENLEKRPERKWHNPIFYKLDGTHTLEEQDIIRSAFQHWEQHTCMRFFEVNVDADIPQEHLLITNEDYGCYSFVGKTGEMPQQINLAPSCLTQFGIPVHEIGHALGLWHEQQRVDRDDWIKINRANIGYYLSQFWKRNTKSHGVPYDYTSVMHYTGKAGSYNGKPTIEALDPLYNPSLGQRTGLSYMDAKIVNLLYCSAECGNALPRPCERGGYQDPNDCYSCICPDGFSGRYCQVPAQSSHEECGGVIYVGYTPTVVQTPGYMNPGHYEDYTECNWIIKAPLDHTVKLVFEEGKDFGVYCHQETCFHWVEVKYQTDFEYPGPRFCCYNTPENNNITSETNEMAVIFKSDFPTVHNATRKGFRALVVAVPPEGVLVDENTELSTIQPIPTEPPGTHWSEWNGYCQNHECKCGGCSVSSRQRMCGQFPCTGDLAAVEEKPCDKQCTDDDYFLQYTGNFVWTPCPTCCPGFSLKDGVCQPDDSSNKS